MADEPIDIERPACFYLGREYDIQTKSIREDRPPVMYDARDLLTHGVVVGMTGSGKTGLCVSLLEEAAIDGISCIIIDPKGDLCNLLLQFPELDPADFKKWINPEDARIKGMTLDDYAVQTAEKWKAGLEGSLQSAKRIELLKNSSEFAVYTPGSDSGLPLAILKTFSAPPPGLPREELAQRIDATVAALLGLTGISADPLQSREHVFIAQLLLHAWNKGEDLDLAQLIGRVQVPPIRTIGAFDVETFYPEKDRLKLALALNNLLASPSFATWIEGDPLDLTVLMKGSKPRQVIFYLAHLDDSQRMFFISLLLSEILSWTRKQQGSTSLKHIVYFDEVFGYIPPHPANPPTKAPLMTLMKQARAFGVGILLATQNPVDLDYKALSNAGTWIIGKLQTDRDKARLISGLEGVAAERGTLSDRGFLDNVISALGNRVFLLHDVHQPKPVIMQSRWALTFLRGPMTRDQVADLMAPLKEQRAAEPATVDAAAGRAEDRSFREKLQRTTASMSSSASHVAPGLPSGLVPYYLKATLPVASAVGPDGTLPPKRSLVYRAMLLGLGEVDFFDKKRGLEFRRKYHLLAEAPEGDPNVAWASATAIAGDIADDPAANAKWGEVPEALNTSRKLKSLQKSFGDYLYSSARCLVLESHAKLGLLSAPGEDALTFQARCRSEALRHGEAELRGLESAYVAKREQLATQMPEVAVPPVASTIMDLPVLNWFKLGPKKITFGPRNPAETRKGEQIQQKIIALDAEWQVTQAKVWRAWEGVGEKYTEILLTPRKADVRVTTFGLTWTPHWQLTHADGHVVVVPAYGRTGVGGSVT